MENLLDLIGYHEKWHATVQNHRTPYVHNQNEHLIDEIFRRMKITEGVCVEFGAWDGIHLSNTKNLIDKGWYSVQIEADAHKFKELEKNYATNPRVTCLHSLVNTTDSLFDEIISRANLGDDWQIDFCSIDIDGLDVEVFETFEKNLPSVVCIEGGQMLHPFHPRIPPAIAQKNIQQSLSVMNNVFSQKGYRPICSYQDTFFVKDEFYHLFDVSENLMDLYLGGVAAFPKVPWIQLKLEEAGLSNEIMDSIIAQVSSPIFNFVKSQGKKVHKMQWVDDNYENILKVLASLRD